MDLEVVVAVVLGALQGALEWLPVSSEGFVSVALTALGASPEAAVGLSLFLHAGTAVAAAVFYWRDLQAALAAAPEWRPRRAFADRPTADLTYLGVATATSGVVGVAAFLAIEELVSELTGGAFLALVGALLVATGVLQHRAGIGGRPDERSDEEVEPDDVADPDARADGAGGADAPGRSRTGDRGGRSGDRNTGGVGARDGRSAPDLVDSVVVGALQGLAILPGVSRSGTTASALLLRGHDGPRALELSFLLSVPAALGAGAIAIAEAGGVPAVSPATAVVALAVAAVVGYLTVDALTRIVERLPFPAVCVGLGGLAVAGGLIAALL